MLYYGARYYDPTAGRFISPDSLIPDPGNVLDYNRYLYARGNPLKYNDPTGHCALSAVAGPMGLVADVPCWIAEGAIAAGAAVATVGGVAGSVAAIGFVLGEPELNYPPPFPAHEPGQLTESFPLPGATTLTIEGVPLVNQDSGGIQGFGPVENTDWNVLTAGGTEPNDIGAWGVKVVQEYFPEVQVGQVPVINASTGQVRRYDGILADVDGGNPVYVEIKASQGQKASIGISSRIRSEIGFDTQQSPSPIWIFVGRPPSSGLGQLLDESGIDFETIRP